MNKQQRYDEVAQSIRAILDDEDDWVAAMATVACELHYAMPHFHWTGFYRVTAPELLVIGPYQGSHGCLRIDFSRGVCGTAARTRTTQLVPDVTKFPGHIACSSTTRSEIVVPIVTADDRLLGVLDVDSDDADAFDLVDQANLESICSFLGAEFG